METWAGSPGSGFPLAFKASQGGPRPVGAPRRKLGSLRTSLVVSATLALDALFFAFNLVVFLQGGSRAVLSQAVSTLTDIIGSLMILWGQWAAALPASPKHPFGRGKERFFWAYSAGLVTFALAGGLVFTEGLEQALAPRSVSDLSTGLLTVGGTLLASFGSFLVVMLELRRDKRTVHQLLEGTQLGVKTIFLQDLVSLAGAAVALSGIAIVRVSGMPMFDGVAAAIVGALLLYTGFALAAEGREFLVGRAVSAEEGRAILSLVERYPFVRHVLGMQSMVLGPDDRLVVLRVNFMDEMNTDDVEMHIDQLRRFVAGEFPRVQHLIIEPVRAAGEQLVVDERPSPLEGGAGQAASPGSGPALATRGASDAPAPGEARSA